jgi:hypothetical protein
MKRRSSIGCWGASEKAQTMKPGKLVAGAAVAILLQDAPWHTIQGASKPPWPRAMSPSTSPQCRNNPESWRSKASVRARTFLDSSRGFEHGKRVRVGVQPFRFTADPSFGLLVGDATADAPEATGHVKCQGRKTLAEFLA